MQVSITPFPFAAHSEEPLKLLENAGLRYSLNPLARKLSADEAIRQLSGCVGVIAGTEPLTRGVLERCRDLRVISRLGAGMDNVDMKAAAELGITVRNTPFGATRAVAELTLGLMLNLVRRVTELDRAVRSGQWKEGMGWLLEGKKVGIVGFGRIGQSVAQVVTCMGCEVAYSDLRAVSTKYPQMELEALLGWADIVTLHCSQSDPVCSLISKNRLQTMKKGAWLINAGRGGLVDEQGLFELLRSGHLQGAAIDCFGREPYDGPLTELPNVILTPHIGASAREGRIRMEIDAVKNLLEAL